IAILSESIELVTLLPMLDPNFSVPQGTDQMQTCVQVDVVCSEFIGKTRLARQVVVVITDHHGHPDAFPCYSELIKNGLMGSNDVFKLIKPVYESEFPETERIADDQ